MARVKGTAEERERARLAKLPPSICTVCGEQIDLLDFRDRLRRKEFPITHTCGRELYRGP